MLSAGDNAWEHVEATREHESCLAFLASHPFPEYDELIQTLESEPEWNRRNEEQRAELWNALDKLNRNSGNYDACKELYKNILDKEKCKQIGQRVYLLGGMPALHAVYYVVTQFSPFTKSDQMHIRAMSCLLKYSFDGIGEWRA